jgi:hypothetical protein
MHRFRCMTWLALAGLLLGQVALAGETAPGVTDETVTAPTLHGMPPGLAAILGNEVYPVLFRTLDALPAPDTNDLALIRASLQEGRPRGALIGRDVSLFFEEGFRPGSALEQYRVGLHEATTKEKRDALKLKNPFFGSHPLGKALKKLHDETKEGPSSFSIDYDEEGEEGRCWRQAGSPDAGCRAIVERLIQKAMQDSGISRWMADVETERNKAMAELVKMEGVAKGSLANLITYLRNVHDGAPGKLPPGDLKEHEEMLEDPEEPEHLGFEPVVKIKKVKVDTTKITALGEGGYWIDPESSDNMAWAYYRLLGVADRVGPIYHADGFSNWRDPNATRPDLANPGLVNVDPDTLPASHTTGCGGTGPYGVNGSGGSGGSGDCTGAHRHTTTEQRTTAGGSGGGGFTYRRTGRPPAYGDAYIPGSAARSLNPGRSPTGGQRMMSEIAQANVEFLKISRNAGDNRGLKMGAALSAIALTLGGAISANQQDSAHVRSTVGFLDSPTYRPPSQNGGTNDTTVVDNAAEELARQRDQQVVGQRLQIFAENLESGVQAPLAAFGLGNISPTKETALGPDQAGFEARIATYAAAASSAHQTTQQFDHIIGDSASQEALAANSELKAATAKLQTALEPYRTASGSLTVTYEQAMAEGGEAAAAQLQQAIAEFTMAVELAKTEFHTAGRATQDGT